MAFGVGYLVQQKWVNKWAPEGSKQGIPEDQCGHQENRWGCIRRWRGHLCASLPSGNAWCLVGGENVNSELKEARRTQARVPGRPDGGLQAEVSWCDDFWTSRRLLEAGGSGELSKFSTGRKSEWRKMRWWECKQCGTFANCWRRFASNRGDALGGGAAVKAVLTMHCQSTRK